MMALKEALRFLRHHPSLSRDVSSRAAPALFLQQSQGFRADRAFTQDGDDPIESADDFEKRLFGDLGDESKTDSFYKKLDKFQEVNRTSSFGPKRNNSVNSGFVDSINEGFDSLSDGMDEKLKNAARTFAYSEEIFDDDYKFRPDMTFRPGDTYTTRDLDLTKSSIPKSFQRGEFETTTKEVLKKADFRNVRFLANFLTEAGIIIKRSQTRISAKAQRKIAREIKTARAFGLMPFTTMGTKPFIFGRSMKDEEAEYEFDDNIPTFAADPIE